MAQTNQFGDVLDEEQPQKSMENALLDIAPSSKQPAVKTNEFGDALDEEQPSLLERTHAATEKLDPLTMQRLMPIAEAFGVGFKEGFGDHKLGLSEDDLKALRESKIFREADQRGLDSWRAPFQAMSEIALNTIWDAGTLAARTGSGLLGGYQQSVQVAFPGQFGKMLAALPEAFFGTPHPMGVPKVGELRPVPEVKVPEYKPFDPARPKDLPSPTPANINEPGSPFKWVSDKDRVAEFSGQDAYDAAVRKSKEMSEGDRKALEDEEKQITQSAIDSGREEFTKEEQDRLQFIDRKLADASDATPFVWRVLNEEGLASAVVEAAWSPEEGRYLYASKVWQHGEDYAEHESPEFGTLNAAKQWAEDHLKGRDPDVKELRKQEQPELRARAAERTRQGFQVVEGGGLPAGETPKPQPYVKPTEIKSIEGSAQPGLSRVEAAQTGIPHVDAILNDPTTKKVIENPIVDRSHTVPYTAGGSVPLEDPTMYIDRRFPKEFTVDGVKFDPAEPFAIHENVEQHVMEALIKGGMDKQVAYKVAHFEFAEKAEGAWYKAHGIDQEKAEAAYKPYMDKIQKGKADNVPPNLYKDPYPHDAPSAAKSEALDEPKPTQAELQQALEILKTDQGAAKEAPAGPKPVDLAQARELGVIGPDKPPISEGTPAEAAARVTGGGAEPPAGGGKGGGEPPGGGGPGGAEPPKDDPWGKRWQQFTGKLDAETDVVDLIRAADRENFGPARQGEIPLAQQEGVGQAAGIEPGTVDWTGVGRKLKNDNQVRLAMQAMMDAAEAVKAAARDVKADASPANLIKLQEAMLRRNLTVEQIVGLRAEWGRTGNVFQEFLRDVKDQETLSDFLKDKGQTAEDLKDIANGIDALDRESAAKVLSDMNKKKPNPFYWTWVNGLISGMLTHTKYIGANAVYLATEHGVTTPIAAVIGKIKQLVNLRTIPKEGSVVAFRNKATGELLIGKPGEVHVDLLARNGIDVFSPKAEGYEDGFVNKKGSFTMERGALTGEDLADIANADRVFFGESMAATWGAVSAVPTALTTAWRSIVSGQRAVLKSELELHRLAVERGEKVPPVIDRAVNQISGLQKPEFFEKHYIWGRIVGAPGDAAMGIHTFFKVLGERASLNALAYRETIKSGRIAIDENFGPTDPGFMDRYNELRANPTEDMLAGARADAYKGTFMQELGPHGKRWQNFTKQTPGVKWLFPFSHIPVNLMKATYEHTPFALLDSTMRDDIMGRNGGVAQDKAIARMVVGSAVMGYFFNSYMNGQSTGAYPLDPKERDHWKLTGKQENSILINGYWVSYNKFGPAGDLAAIGANLGHLVEHAWQGWKESDDETMTRATWQAADAAGRLVSDEVGFQTLANLFEALHDEKKGTSMVAYQAATAMPFSSFIRQTASGGIPFTGGVGGDPYMRQVKSFTDALKYTIPGMRETLMPRRDFLGEPFPNPQYGNILRSSPDRHDLVSSEMDRLQVHPAPPQDRIGGVKLPPRLYDEYQVRAGAIARVTLENWVKQPGWEQLLPGVQVDILRTSIQKAHEAAASIMQARYPQIIRLGVDNRERQIRGEKPGTIQDVERATPQ